MSEWLEAHLRLPQGLAAEPGPIKLYPYQRGIADALNDPKIERVSIKRSSASDKKSGCSVHRPISGGKIWWC